MPERVDCDHAERCGGCPLIALSYDEQLVRKRARVADAFARHPSLDLVAPEPVAPAEPIVGYRTRAKLIVAPGGSIGLFAKGGGHHVVDVPRCRVLSPVLGKIAQAIRERAKADEASGGPLAPFDPAGGGALRALDLREVRERDEAPRVLVTFVIERTRTRPDDLEALAKAARELMRAAPEVIGVAANFHQGEVPQILGGETVALAGVSRASDRVGASTHFATFGSFVQAHREQTGRVHALLADAIARSTGGAERTKKPRVLDLYGGSGSIALALAGSGASVVLVESFAPAVEQAAAAARDQGLDVEAVCADVVAGLRARTASAERFDAVVVNPPRRGTSPRAREALAQLDPAVVAYVSCDPDTLARDVEHLARLGYAPSLLQPLDMIPLTDEVETVAILRRGPIPPPAVVYEDAEVLIVEKGSHEPTTPQGEYAGSLLARVRRIPRAEEAVPAQRPDVGTSGLVVFARRAEHLARWQQALAAATTRVIHVAAVRGVSSPKGRIARELHEDGKLVTACTRYRRLTIASGHSVLRVVTEPMEAGRTPPIRQHLASIGHPVLGDERFGHAPTNRYFEEKCGLDRTFLHCSRLELVHPDTGKPIVAEAPLTGDLLSVFDRLGVDAAVLSANAALRRRRPRPPPAA